MFKIKSLLLRFEETSQLSTACTPQDAAAEKCYGGFARIATLVRQAKSESPSTIFLNAGDTYQGTAWYNLYKWEGVAWFMNLLQPDAIVNISAVFNSREM